MKIKRNQRGKVKKIGRRLAHLIVAVIVMFGVTGADLCGRNYVSAFKLGEVECWRWDLAHNPDEFMSYFDSPGTIQRVLLVYDQDEEDDWYYVQADYWKYTYDNYWNGMHTGSHSEYALGADSFISAGDMHAFYTQYIGYKENNYWPKCSGESFAFHGREEDGSMSPYMLFTRGQGYFQDGDGYVKRTDDQNSHFARAYEDDKDDLTLHRGYLEDKYDYGSNHSRIEETKDNLAKFSNSNAFSVSNDYSMDNQLLFFAVGPQRIVMQLSHDVSVGASYYGDDYFGVERNTLTMDKGFKYEDYLFYVYVGTMLPAYFAYYTDDDMRDGRILVDNFRVYNSPVWLQRGQTIEVTEGAYMIVSTMFVNEGLIKVNGGTLIVTKTGAIHSREYSGTNGSILCTNGGDIILTTGAKMYCRNKLSILSAPSDVKKCSVINYGFLATGKLFECKNAVFSNRGTLSTAILPKRKCDLNFANWNEAFTYDTYNLAFFKERTVDMENIAVDHLGTFYESTVKVDLTREQWKNYKNGKK